jgi:hypothetical protein
VNRQSSKPAKRAGQVTKKSHSVKAPGGARDETPVTWATTFNQALACVDADAKALAKDFTLDEMNEVCDLVDAKWHSDDPRLGVETLEHVIELAIFYVGCDRVPVPRSSKVLH